MNNIDDCKPQRENYKISKLTEIYLKWKYSPALSWKLNQELSGNEKMDLIEILNSYILINESKDNKE